MSAPPGSCREGLAVAGGDSAAERRCGDGGRQRHRLVGRVRGPTGQRGARDRPGGPGVDDGEVGRLPDLTKEFISTRKDVFGFLLSFFDFS